jgi:hypothetical protein
LPAGAASFAGAAALVALLAVAVGTEALDCPTTGTIELDPAAAARASIASLK